MSEQINYQKEVCELQSEKNSFIITHYFPQYISSNQKTVKADVENQLFTVFRKYEQEKGANSFHPFDHKEAKNV